MEERLVVRYNWPEDAQLALEALHDFGVVMENGSRQEDMVGGLVEGKYLK